MDHLGIMDEMRKTFNIKLYKKIDFNKSAGLDAIDQKTLQQLETLIKKEKSDPFNQKEGY